MSLSSKERYELGDLFTAHTPRLPRRLHELFAKLNGYFWLPCPLCGELFGGHEWRDIDGKPAEIPDPDHAGRGIGICPACTRAGRGLWPAACDGACTASELRTGSLPDGRVTDSGGPANSIDDGE